MTALATEAEEAIRDDAENSKLDDIKTRLEAAVRDLAQAAQGAQGEAGQPQEGSAQPDEDVIDADFKPAD